MEEAAAEEVARRVSLQNRGIRENWETPRGCSSGGVPVSGPDRETPGNVSSLVSLRDERLRRREPVDFSRLPHNLPPQARDWADRVVALDPDRDPCPGLRSGDWTAIRCMIFDFLVRHAARAVELGWPELELFGVHSEVGVARLDCCGALIVASLAQMTVVSDVAPELIRGQEGLVYRRHALARSETLWAAATQ